MVINPLSIPSIHNPFVVWEGAIDAQSLKAFTQYADAVPHHTGTVDVGNQRYDGGTRVTRVAWIERSPLTGGFYDRIEEIILSLNSQFFQYELTALAPLQHVVYDASEQGHLEWHIDYAKETGHKAHEFRKLSLSIQLSDPREYEGGELQAQVKGKVQVAPKMRGTVIAFPSFVLHRVTLVTAGVRKALVVWVLGPDFR
jgi:PKHD-type hydroxylase